MARMAHHGFRARVIAFSPHTDDQEMENLALQNITIKQTIIRQRLREYSQCFKF